MVGFIPSYYLKSEKRARSGSRSLRVENFLKSIEVSFAWLEGALSSHFSTVLGKKEWKLGRNLKNGTGHCEKTIEHFLEGAC